MDTTQSYGLWVLVAVNSAIFILFSVSFFHPQSRRDWRALGALSAFLVALFTEMYGFPLTIYLLSGWLGTRFPALAPTHAGGHLFNDLIGWRWDPHLSPFHLASYLFIGGGFWLISSAWTRLLKARKAGLLAVDGPYARLRHPQYLGLIVVMLGFLLQWPTLVTLVMFPLLVFAYSRLARAEEEEVAGHFGPVWAEYAARTPRFVARIHRRRTPQSLDQPAAAQPQGV